MVTQGAPYSKQYFNEFGSGRYSPPQRGVQVLKPTIISYGGAPKSGNSPGKSNENVSVSSNNVLIVGDRPSNLEQTTLV